MARTLKENRFLCRTNVCCCAVLLLLVLMFRIDGAQAASNSSGAVATSSDGHSGGGDDEGNTMEKGMRPFFDMVQGFLGVVQPKKLHEETWLNLSSLVTHGKLDSDQLLDWNNWVLYLIGFVVCAAVGVLFFLVMPIVGLVFCCCRCAGRCGGKPKPQDPKHARCKRTTYCSLLLVFNTMALAGVVCAFLSNEILYDKLRNENDQGPTGRLIDSANNLNSFVNNTVNDIENRVLVQFRDARDNILRSITDAAEQAVQDVLDRLNTSSLLDQSKAVAREVNTTKHELANVATQLRFLSTQGELLSENLTTLAAEIDAVCPAGSPCSGIDTSSYAISANFSGLDNLSAEFNKVEAAIDLDDYIVEAERTVDSAKKNATDTVNSTVTGATDSVNTVETSIRDAMDSIRADVDKHVMAEVNKFLSGVTESQDDITEYSKYVWAAGLGIACALLLVVVLYYVGVLYGLCGERPGFGAQCCNTGTGANFLMAGVGFTFILSWLIMLVCIITFLLGGPLYTEMCRYFDDHEAKELKPFSDMVMNYVDLANSLFDGQDVELNLVTILQDCENNSPIYSVLKLEHMVNLTKELDLSEVEAELNKLKSMSYDIPDVDILSTDMNDSLTDFASSGVEDIAFGDYYAQVNKSMTAEDLPTLANQLRSAATAVPPPDNGRLLSVAAQLDELQDGVVTPMQRSEDSMKASLDYLQNQAAKGIKQSTEALRQTLQDADTNFNRDKDRLVQDAVVVLVDGVMDTIRKLVDGAVHDVHHEIGKCRPLFDSFYSASDSICIVALEPFNSFWFSLGWCLFFFVPALIFAVKLAGLYRREHEERDFDDP